MVDQVFNIALGRMVEFYDRVDKSDPTNAVLTVIAWVVTATDAVIKDVDDVAALEGTALVAEVTNSGYTRKELDDTDLVAFVPDYGNDRTDLDIPDQTWTGVSAGDVWSDLSINYDSDSLGGIDANIVCGTWHDFVVTPNGGDITAQIAAVGFFRAS